MKKKKKKKMIKSSVAKIKSPEVMKPLKDFMSQNKINTSMLGERMGLTRQDICHILKNDTAKISMLEKIAEAMECTLKLSLCRNGRCFCNEAIAISSIYRKTDVIPIRLHFFFNAISQSGLSYEKVAAALDVKHSTVRYWFRTDDTMVRYIKEFADTLGFDFNIEFIPVDYCYNRNKHNNDYVEFLLNLICGTEPIRNAVIDAIIRKMK